MICSRNKSEGCFDELQNEEELTQDLANAQSELAATLESHRAALAEIQGGFASYIPKCMHSVCEMYT